MFQTVRGLGRIDLRSYNLQKIQGFKSCFKRLGVRVGFDLRSYNLQKIQRFEELFQTVRVKGRIGFKISQPTEDTGV